MKILLYNKIWSNAGSNERLERRPRTMRPMETYHLTSRREHRRQARWRVWNRIVLAIGYATIAYHLVRGVIYLLVLAQDWVGK